MLADVIYKDEPLVYFDSASFNMWMRPRCSWSYYQTPIHNVLNQNRGTNITVLGAISAQFTSKPLLVQADTPNAKTVANFLQKLRQHFSFARDKRIKVVLDNASAHSDRELTKTRDRLRIDFLFLPAYTPELNSIECLWSVIKKDFKQRLATVKFDKLAQTEFS